MILSSDRHQQGMSTMPVLDLADLRKALSQGKRLLGLDVGTKTIGLALSDPSLAVASPIETLRRTKFTKDAESLLALIRGHEVGGLVVGLPVNLNGSEGPRCQSKIGRASCWERVCKYVEIWGVDAL